MILTITTSIVYAGIWLYLISQLLRGRQAPRLFLSGAMTIALVIHAFSLQSSLIVEGGYQLGFFKIASLYFWVINLLVTLSALKKPLHSLFSLLLPLTLIAVMCAGLLDSPVTPSSDISPGILMHIAFSILAYSVMTMAAIQALILAYQNHQLRFKHPTGLVQLLPPLQTMEALLFEIIWVGEILLTLSIASGTLFVENLLGQHLTHKTTFTLLSWLIFAILLWGRHKLGWRGNSAIRWTLAGFACLILAYFGSKLVLEIILQRS